MILLTVDEIDQHLSKGMREWVKESKADATPQAMVRYGARYVAKAQLKKALIGVGKETKRMDGTTYLVPNYHKYREALKEVE